ncbi:uncharacterized protein E5676_scaffold352G007420 [Cucumis melo var. makuwa]|uniref:Retrotransposon gag domain-containing protein n=1 Tax=Cucumis melo var. makuwa TaxID=1194695 RepID=A0A5D3DPT5_CUCMM|nr:uncharacterized protein E6C27_scaffold135G002040 [Cucumis melo var. makuwa]TYK25584.1 uncharacterized protein E5676_scaffold352G007420 [Cucumis melo var. makuwa]
MLSLAEVPDSIRFLESRLEEITEKTDTIDVVVGRVEGLPIQNSSGFVAHMEERVNELDSSQKTLLEMINDMSEDFRATLDVVRNEIVDVNARLNLTMRAIANQAPAGGAIPVSRVKIPEPKPFCGARNAKALKNYIFDLEQYFRATNTITEEAKVTLATNHLSEDAKLWWRSRYVDMQEGRSTIDTWDALKRELRSQFFPENVEILPRRKLRELKHTDSIRDSSPGRNRNSSPSSPKAVGGDKRSGKDRRPYLSTTENTWRRPNNRSPPKRLLSCFICEGLHLTRECPNKVDFHAFQASLITDSDDKSNQAEGEVGQIDGGEKTRIGAIKYMSSLQKKSGERHVPTKGGLLYVDTWINQKQIKSNMVDFGATHNFITKAEARRLRLRWKKNSGRMKVVNSIALPIVRLVKQTMIKLRGWKGPVDFVVVKMEDFDVVLGMVFLLKHQVIPMPSARCLVITGSFPTVVQADIRQPNEFKMISAMQLDKNRAQEELPYVEIPLGALGKMEETVPKDTLCVPEKYHCVMPKSWPKSLSMRRMINHGIESPPEAKAPAKNAHRTMPPEKKDRNSQRRIKRSTRNKLTASRKYPFSLLPNLVDRSRGVKCFPKSDIRLRYCRVKATEAKGLKTTCVTELRAYKFPMAPFSLTDAKERKCCFV